MSAPALVEKLRSTAAILKPFTRQAQRGALVWNGTAYVPPSGEAFDPFALSWWGVLTTIADMLEAQGTSVTASQREYLDRLLFGGMGSLNDFVLDAKRLGQVARDANACLDQARREMFEAFRQI